MGTWFATTDQINYVLNAVRKVVSREYRKGTLTDLFPVVYIFPPDEDEPSITLDAYSAPEQYQKVGEMMAAESESIIGKLPYDQHPFNFHEVEMGEAELRTAVVLSTDMKNGMKTQVRKRQPLSVTQQVCEQFVDNWIYLAPEMHDQENLMQVYHGARQRWDEERKMS